MKFSRLLRHLLMSTWWTRRAFRAADLKAIGAAIAESESHHRGELRFVVEGPLNTLHVLRGFTPRQRAIEVFSQLKVWDTEENCGILIYVQMVDRKVEILADRGISAKVPQAEWDSLCRGMEKHFARGEYRDGVIQALQGASGLLSAHFPAQGARPNELPDAPVLL
ncbi:MAG TPA: TPM domain-containing protein [Rhodocyclaceae bacterium]|jgi:uncharacterized DUF497 family protein